MISKTTLSVIATEGMLIEPAIFALVQGDSAIARRRGEATSVKSLSDGVSEVCIKNTTDAGGNYGDRKNLPSVCWHGLLEGVSPAVGDCVILQVEGETSYLRVETAEG